MLYVAFLLYMLDIRIPQRYVLCLLVGLGLFFSRYELHKIRPKYNMDLPSYIQQIGKFWRGELNYERLDGECGAAYYPAG